MEKKFYVLVTALFLLCLQSVRSQDSTACNPGFFASSNLHVAGFSSYDPQPNIQHAWRFGDGTSLPFNSNQRSVTHYYALSGHYTVVHTIRDSLGVGCFDSSVQVVVIDTVPVCSVTIFANIDSTGHQNRFSFIAFPFNSGDMVHWYVNDSLVGSTDTLQNYVFPSGNYTVCAHLQTAAGCLATACLPIHVADSSSDTTHMPPPDTTQLPPPPVDSCAVSYFFRVDPSHSNEIHFIANDSMGLDILTWVISRPFDTANTVILHGANAVHVFTDTGCYRVELFSLNPQGCASHSSASLCIDSLPDNNLIPCYPNPTHGLAYLDVKTERAGMIYISIFNNMGHLMQIKDQWGMKGANHIVLPTACLPNGIYYIQVKYGNVTKKSKIQKL